MISYTFKKGEIRRFEFMINNSEDETLVITSAFWKVTNGKNETVASGDCYVDGTELSMVIPMNTRGDFCVEITVTIPPETIKERVMVRVVD